jgi:hypothetical protein
MNGYFLERHGCSNYQKLLELIAQTPKSARVSENSAWHLSRLDRKLSVPEHGFAVDCDCGSVDHEVPVD